MTNNEKACTTFEEGFNCAQAVFATYAEQFGLDHEVALKIAGAFGGGMARMGDTCGAVTGAFMVIGLKHGKAEKKDDPARERTYKLTNEFAARFQGTSWFDNVQGADQLRYQHSRGAQTGTRRENL